MRIQVLTNKTNNMIDIFKEINKHFENCFADISRGKNNEISKVANTKVNKEQGRHLVFNLIDGTKSTKEIADILGKEIHKISGRFSELKMQGLIELDHYKDGYSVYKQIK